MKQVLLPVIAHLCGRTGFNRLCTPVYGGLGLILPGVTRIQPGLTALAAAALAFVALSATVAQLMGEAPGNAAFALVMALLCILFGA